MDIHGPTFAAFVALGLSPAGLDEAERKILALDQEFGQAKLIKWLFQSIRGLPKGDKPTVTLSPADELYLEGLLSLIEQVNGYPFTPSSARVYQISTKLDFLSFARNDRHWSPVKLANFFYRSNIIPTKGAAIVASLRNEAINVLEWIGHHRALGFEDFFFYVNDSDDGTVELLEALARSGVCHLILNETHLKKNGEDYFPIQAKALEHAIHLLAPLRAFEWVLFSDADEFLVTKQIVTDPVCGRPLNHLIERLNDQQNELSGVLFNWKWFGSKAAYSREEGLHFERFCNFVGSRLVKTFARLSRCIAFPTSHLPRLLHGDHVLDGALEVATNYNIDMPIAYDYGQINHYWNKSFEEFVAKQLRGWGYRSYDKFFTWGNNENYGRFERLPVEWIDRVKGEVRLLKSLPDVERWHNEAESRFRQSIERYDTERNLAALYLSERFGRKAETTCRSDHQLNDRVGILRHVVALPQTRARQPLLPGTEHFAAPWLRYWHEQADQPAVEDVACYSVLGAVVSRRGATWHDNKPFVPADLGHEGKVPSIACPDDTLLLRTVQSPCMVISGHQGDSYQNRVWDWMLRVGTARHLAQSLNLPLRILLDNAAPDWVPNLIRRVWGIGPDAIEIYDPESERVFLQHALLPTNPLGVHGLHPFFDGVINEIAAYERPPSSAPKIRRIFLKQISPNQQPNHGCCNEMDLIQAAALYGFMPISIENLSWLGRIKLFSEADIVVNNSDLDMTSALFCRSETRFASVGFRTILTSEIGTLRNVQNSYFMLGTESSSQYRVELKAFSEFLVRLCS